MSTDIEKKELTFAERFTNKVMELFAASAGGDLALTDFQKRLAQNYCIVADRALKTAEEKRMKKIEKYRDEVPVTWVNVDMDDLALNVVSAARVGWDPMQSNHVSLIPYKKNAIDKYSMTLMPGYRGIELRATKYGLNIPDAVVVELVFSTDKFKSFKKDRNNRHESYEFEITNDFDRGKIVGGFYYHYYAEHPEKNKLVVMTIKEIEKRKPAYASAEFWGGEKDVWDNGKKVGKETTEGWYEKMCYKTVYRAAYGDITIDSQKIDDDYLKLRQMEMSLTELKVAEEIAENANKEFLDITNTTTVIDEPSDAPDHADLPPTGTEGGGPGF